MLSISYIYTCMYTYTNIYKHLRNKMSTIIEPTIAALSYATCTSKDRIWVSTTEQETHSRPYSIKQKDTTSLSYFS